MMAKISREKPGITISVCLIVKNEESVLTGCLSDAAAFADEIIVVDTGSTDKTREIACSFTEKVFDFSWVDDFAAARNFSFSKASCDYIMWLDADDRIFPENAEKINRLKEKLHAKVVYAGYERPENGGVYLYPRIIKRDAGFIWQGIVHEHLVLSEGAAELVEKECVTADFLIRHSKPGSPDYQRNIRLMERLPLEELRESFWLCANCYLDCVLAGEEEKAAYYLKMAAESSTPFEARLNVYALINRVLKHHKKIEAMLRWNKMYLECKNGYSSAITFK